jgi:hypothetical protein
MATEWEHSESHAPVPLAFNLPLQGLETNQPGSSTVIEIHGIKRRGEDREGGREGNPLFMCIH